MVIGPAGVAQALVVDHSVSYVVDKPGAVDANEAESDGGATTNDVKLGPPFVVGEPHRVCNCGLEGPNEGDGTRSGGDEALTGTGIMTLTPAFESDGLGYEVIPCFEFI